jgi:predicted ester cyclase
VEEGDIVVGIWSADVEHVGQFLHVPATGKRFGLKGITAYTLRDGRVTGHWEQFEVLTILTELGVVPPLNS